MKLVNPWEEMSGVGHQEMARNLHLYKEVYLIGSIMDPKRESLMRKRTLIILIGFATLVLTSCGAIPTLPPLDSTVSVWTPQVILDPGLVTATSEVEVRNITGTPAAAITEIPKDPTATSKPKMTSTAIPVITATPSFTPTATATEKPAATFTPTAVPYSLQLMNPFYLKNFTHDDLGCAWLGVAGQIFNHEGQVQKNIVIRAGGEVNGTPVIEEMAMPLAEPDTDLAYGPGGFELTLAESLADTESEVWIQLFHLNGDPLSDKVYLTTYDDCQKNLILLNFVEE